MNTTIGVISRGRGSGPPLFEVRKGPPLYKYTSTLVPPPLFRPKLRYWIQRNIMNIMVRYTHFIHDEPMARFGPSACPSARPSIPARSSPLAACSACRAGPSVHLRKPRPVTIATILHRLTELRSYVPLDPEWVILETSFLAILNLMKKLNPTQHKQVT